jgi:hypothetical protein
MTNVGGCIVDSRQLVPASILDSPPTNSVDAFSSQLRSCAKGNLPPESPLLVMTTRGVERYGAREVGNTSTATGGATTRRPWQGVTPESYDTPVRIGDLAWMAWAPGEEPQMTTGEVSNNKHVYEIRVKGVLHEEWSHWFEDMTIIPQVDGETLLTGPLADQAALHGLLEKIRNLGLPLLAVELVESEEKDTTMDGGE